MEVSKSSNDMGRPVVQVEMNRVKRLFREVALELDSMPIEDHIHLSMALKSTNYFAQCVLDPLQKTHRDRPKKLKVAYKAKKIQRFVCGLSRKLCL